MLVYILISLVIDKAFWKYTWYKSTKIHLTSNASHDLKKNVCSFGYKLQNIKTEVFNGNQLFLNLL